MRISEQSAAGSWTELLGRRHRGVITVLAGGVAVYATNVFVTTSLLPTAVGEIGGERYYAWATTVFLIASVIASMCVAALVAARGPRGAYLTGLGAFGLGTLVCGLGPTMEVLLLGRVVQGLGGGLLAGLSYALINAALPSRLWTRGSALVSAMWGVGTFVGPALGGLFAQLGAWRWAFFTLLAFVVVLALLVPRALPARIPERAPTQRIPFASLALLTVAALLVSIASVVSSGVLTALGIIAATALVGCFVLVDRRAQSGVLPRTVYGPSPLKWIYLTIAVLAMCSMVETFIPLFGQRLAGLAPLAAGFLGAAIAAGWTLGQIPSASASAPNLVRRIVFCGPLLIAAGLGVVGLTQVSDAGGAVLLAWVLALLLTGAGIGVAWPHLAAGAMTAVEDPAEGAQAAAAINTVQLIANSFGAALAGVLVNLGGDSTEGSARLLLLAFAALAVVGVAFARRAMPR